MSSGMSIHAWRLYRSADGMLCKRIAVSTPNWPTMYGWLLRSRAARAKHPHTMWIEQGRLPATLVHVPLSHNQGLREQLRQRLAELKKRDPQ